MSTTPNVQTIQLHTVAPWPGLNPRRTFASAGLLELGKSLADDGQIQPCSVAPVPEPQGDGVEWWLFIGERRLRAATLQGLQTLEVIVREIDEKTAHRLAGLENLERQNLSAIEEGIWLQKELELTDLSQRALAKELEKSQAWIANRIRLLRLPKSGKKLLEDGIVSPATAKDVLLPLLSLNVALVESLFSKLSIILRKELARGQQATQSQVEASIPIALKADGARTTQSGTWCKVGKDYITIPTKALDDFRAARKDRCVLARPANTYGGPVWWTYDTDGWKAVEKSAAEAYLKQRGSPSAGGTQVSSTVLADPKLDRTKKAKKLHELQGKYGHPNVVELADCGDLCEVEPSHVTTAEIQVRDEKNEAWIWAERLVYIGANADALKNQGRTELLDAERKAGERITKKALAKAPSSPNQELVRGLLNVLFQTDTFQDMIELLKVQGVELSEELQKKWSLGDFGALADLELSSDQELKLAGGLAHLCGDRHGNNSRAQARIAAQKTISARAAKRIEKWEADHA